MFIMSTFVYMVEKYLTTYSKLTMFVQCDCRNPLRQSSGSSRDAAADDYATLNLESSGPQHQYDVIQLDPRHGRPESYIDLNEYAELDSAV